MAESRNKIVEYAKESTSICKKLQIHMWKCAKYSQSMTKLRYIMHILLIMICEIQNFTLVTIIAYFLLYMFIFGIFLYNVSHDLHIAICIIYKTPPLCVVGWGKTGIQSEAWLGRYDSIPAIPDVRNVPSLLCLSVYHERFDEASLSAKVKQQIILVSQLFYILFSVLLRIT